VILREPNNNEIVHRRANRKLRVQLISALKAYRLLKCKSKGYPCNVVDSAAAELLTENIPIVCEFSGCFPSRIHNMPPPKEVDFGIDLALSRSYF